ncbi:caspase-8-like [Clinocottus analis]|uniref:caspase-8-like n=1 Tax=Clinocottus analis TaxID=304258 RepID=UPI0035C05562
MATLIEVFLGTLEDLGDKEFKRFKWWLQHEDVLEGFPAIRVSELENADREDTVDRMVKSYSKNTIKVIRIVLKKINRNDLVDKLPKNISEPEGCSKEEAEHHLTRMKLEELERQLAQRAQDNSSLMRFKGQEDYYDLYHQPRGLCVVINNEDFQGIMLRNRRGTQEDEKTLRTVFTRLGFTVLVHNNLTAEAIRQVLQELGSRNFSDEDALVVCVLSHGEMGCVFGTDEQNVHIQELTRPFISRRAPTLTGKPKLFFIQACQVGDYQRRYLPCPTMPRQQEVVRKSPLEDDARGGSFEMEYWDADFLLGMATVPHSRTFRNVRTGSIYIQELCKQLTRSAESSKEDDILTVLTRVNREVSKGEYLCHKQIPEPKYTLTKKLVLKYVCADPDQAQS